MKKIISMLLTLSICLSFSAVALADYSELSEEDTQIVEVEETEPTRAEETEWYYRIVDNLIVQKRVWSITYGYWKTDWITIGYVEPNP